MYAWAMFGVGTLLLRTFLLATSANATGFSGFIMRTSSDYLSPFRGIFNNAEIGETGYFDISALFAAVVYLFLGWGFKELVYSVQARIDRNRQAQENELTREALRQSAADMDNVEVTAKGTVRPRAIRSTAKKTTRRSSRR